MQGELGELGSRGERAFHPFIVTEKLMGSIMTKSLPLSNSDAGAFSNLGNNIEVVDQPLCTT